VRLWNEGNGFDLFNAEDVQIRQPPMEAEEGIVVRGHVLWQCLLLNGVIEHPAHSDSIQVAALDTKTDEASGKDIHDHHYPIALQQY